MLYNTCYITFPELLYNIQVWLYNIQDGYITHPNLQDGVLATLVRPADSRQLELGVRLPPWHGGSGSDSDSGCRRRRGWSCQFKFARGPGGHPATPANGLNLAAGAVAGADSHHFAATSRLQGPEHARPGPGIRSLVK